MVKTRYIFHDSDKWKIYSSEIGVAPLSLSRTKGISQGWNAVQVPLTYVGLGTKGYIDVSPEVSNISEIMLEGNYNEVTEGTIIENTLLIKLLS